MVLPCNEYFDDRCAHDTKSALGAFVNKVFEGEVDEFISLSKEECRKRRVTGVEQQKTVDECAVSFGAGQCVLLMNPLGRAVPVALVSTTTQRSGQGLVARDSYLFDGICELVVRLADARPREIAMPVLGAGHGGSDPALAFVTLLLAIAEAAPYAPGGRPLRRVTVIIFKPDAASQPGVHPVVVRRALALVGSGARRRSDEGALIKLGGPPSSPRSGHCLDSIVAPGWHWLRARSRTYPTVCSENRLRFCSRLQ